MSNSEEIAKVWIETLPTPEELATCMLRVRKPDAEWFLSRIGEPVNKYWMIDRLENKETEGYEFVNIYLRRYTPSFADIESMGPMASLERSEMADAVSAATRSRLIIMACVVGDMVWFCRADMKWFSVPKSSFKPSRGGENVPDFDNVTIGDFGWSLCFGPDYEASSDAVMEDAVPL